MIAIASLLFVMLLLIWLIPSGPRCPKCQGYMTEKYHIRNKEIKSIIDGDKCYCYKCKDHFKED